MERRDLSEFQFDGPMKLVGQEQYQSKENCNDPDDKGDILHFSGNKTNDKAGKLEEPWMDCSNRYF